MKVLVTGGAGFIGSHVVDSFVAAGYETVVVDNLSTGLRALVSPNATFCELSVLDQALADVFAEHQPDLICHQAAHVNVRVSVEDPIHDATQNILGTLSLLECARKFGAKRFVFASSGGAIYGEPLEDPVPETHPLRPLSPYGGAKLSCEQYLWMYGANFGISSVSLRYANVYGPRQNPEGEGGVVAIFCRKMLTGKRPTIFGDGEQTRDFAYVADVAAANLAAAETLLLAPKDDPLRLVLNVGTGTHASVNALAQELGQRTGFGLEPDYVPAKVGELRAISLSSELAARTIGWAPRVALSEGLARSAEYFRGVGEGSRTR